MRQNLGAKKIKKLKETTGLDIVNAQVRGGTGHRIDLFLADGSGWCMYPGEIPVLRYDANGNYVAEEAK